MPWSSRLGKSNAPHRKFFLLKKVHVYLCVFAAGLVKHTALAACHCSHLVHELRRRLHTKPEAKGRPVVELRTNQHLSPQLVWFRHKKNLLVLPRGNKAKRRTENGSRKNWLTKSVAQKELAMSFEPSWKNGQTIVFNIRFTSCSACAEEWVAWEWNSFARVSSEQS